jgi:hypothetical protein
MCEYGTLKPVEVVLRRGKGRIMKGWTNPGHIKYIYMGMS